MPRHGPALLLPAAALALGSCGDADDRGGDGSPQPTRPSATDTSTRTPHETATSASGTPTGEGLTSCENPEGFTIGYPPDWHTNEGDVVPPCSQFHPHPFEVPAGTDERVAAVTAWIDPVPFAVASRPDFATDVVTSATEVDGRQATRLEYVTEGHGLLPAGTPITAYVVDVSQGAGDRTLFVDTIGIGDFDYTANQAVLDRMVSTLALAGG